MTSTKVQTLQDLKAEMLEQTERDLPVGRIIFDQQHLLRGTVIGAAGIFGTVSSIVVEHDGEPEA